MGVIKRDSNEDFQPQFAKTNVKRNGNFRRGDIVFLKGRPLDGLEHFLLWLWSLQRFLECR